MKRDEVFNPVTLVLKTIDAFKRLEQSYKFRSTYFYLFLNWQGNRKIA